MTVTPFKTELVDDIGNPMVNVLDKGWVKLVRFDGEDEDVVRAARQSYGEGTTTYRNAAGLIEYLMEHRHMTPFEAVECTIQLKVPLFIVAQIERHRTFSFNQMSARYSVLPGDFYIPALEHINTQSTSNKQGRGEALSIMEAMDVIGVLQLWAKDANALYQGLLESNVARETSRMVLPQNIYTIMTMKGNLRNWQHFLDLRTHSHAQLEIQHYANAIESLMRPRAPHTFEAWDEFVRYAVTFSRSDMAVVREIVSHWYEYAQHESMDVLLPGIKKSRRVEFLKKLGLDGIYMPQEGA